MHLHARCHAHTQTGLQALQPQHRRSIKCYKAIVHAASLLRAPQSTHRGVASSHLPSPCRRPLVRYTVSATRRRVRASCSQSFAHRPSRCVVVSCQRCGPAKMSLVPLGQPSADGAVFIDLDRGLKLVPPPSANCGASSASSSSSGELSTTQLAISLLQEFAGAPGETVRLRVAVTLPSGDSTELSVRSDLVHARNVPPAVLRTMKRAVRATLASTDENSTTGFSVRRTLRTIDAATGLNRVEVAAWQGRASGLTRLSASANFLIQTTDWETGELLGPEPGVRYV